MINSLQWTDIEAIHYHLTLEFIPVLLDMVVLHHDYHHINILQEVFEIIKLILSNLMILQERIITLQWSSQMSFLCLQELQGRLLTIFVHIILIGQAIETYTTVVRDVVLFHNLVDSFEHEHRLIVVSLH